MRDLLMLLLLAGGCIWALRAPWIGAMLWTAISLGSPHVEFAHNAGDWPVASVVAISTLIGLLRTQDRHNPIVGAPSAWLLAFVVWITITLPFSFYFEYSYPLWERSMKIFLMLFVTMALIDSRQKIDVFVWVMVCALGYYGVKGGLFTLATGGNYRVWGPGGFVEGNNELALAMLMTLPLARYLQLQSSSRWVRWGLTASMLLMVVMVLGTHSRGALVGLAAMGFVFWLKSPGKMLSGLAIVGIVFVALPFMPEHWWARMETIKAYEQDGSALGRINAWWNAWNVAKAHLFGGGFIIYTPEVFAIYSPEPERVHAAHSIYFQVLGEHGFIGLAIFLAIGVSTWIGCRRLIRIGAGDPDLRWAKDLGAMIQVSMIGYASAGAFLSLAYFDLPYNLMAVTVLAHYVIARRAPAGTPAVPAASAVPAKPRLPPLPAR